MQGSSPVFGVYAIRNKVTQYIYIGGTKRPFQQRWRQHVDSLREGKHENRYLQQDWDHYGEDAFEFVVIEQVNEPSEIKPTEQRYLDIHYGKRCYNILASAFSGIRVDTDTDVYGKTYPGFVAPDGTKYENVHNLRRFCRDHKLNMSGMGYLLRGEYKQYKGWVLIGNDPYVPIIYSFVDPTGTQHEGITDLAGFCRKHNLHLSHMCAIARGKRRSYKGWTLSRKHSTEDVQSTQTIAGIANSIAALRLPKQV